MSRARFEPHELLDKSNERTRKKTILSRVEDKKKLKKGNLGRSSSKIENWDEISKMRVESPKHRITPMDFVQSRRPFFRSDFLLVLFFRCVFPSQVRLVCASPISQPTLDRNENEGRDDREKKLN